MLGGLVYRPLALKRFERQIQSDQGLNARIAHPVRSKLAYPARRNYAIRGNGHLVAGCMAVPKPGFEALDVGVDVHSPNSSTLVLVSQPQKNKLLPHAWQMDSNTRKLLAANVKRLRLDLGWNQTELGKRSGVGQTTVSSVENGEGKSPTLETISALGRALGVPEWTLLVDGSAMDAAQLQGIDHLVHTYLDLPNAGKTQVQRVAEAEERYAKAG